MLPPPHGGVSGVKSWTNAHRSILQKGGHVCGTSPLPQGQAASPTPTCRDAPGLAGQTPQEDSACSLFTENCLPPGPGLRQPLLSAQTSDGADAV